MVQVASDILLLGVTKEQVTLLQRWNAGDPDAPEPVEHTENKTGLFGQVKQALGFKNENEPAAMQQSAGQADFQAYLNRAQRQSAQTADPIYTGQPPVESGFSPSEPQNDHADYYDPMPADALDGGVEFVSSRRPETTPRHSENKAADELLDRIAKRNERYKK
jgi:hypothetical protein